MPKIKAESLLQGMVVTADVKNMDNMLLLPAGCVITERHIDILNAWGIAEIQVEACEGAEDSSDVVQKLPPETLQKLTEELERIFWEPVDKDPVQTETFKLALQRKAMQMLGRPH
jgi:hypothetical protein